MVLRYDVIEVKAEVTKEGWIRDSPIITRAGIFEYRNANGTVTREYRPDSEVFASASLATANGIPVTDNHRGIINADNVSGIIGTVTGNARQDDKNVVADIVIHNPKQLGSKKELSLGYECEIEQTPGEIDGQRYDCVQKQIRYNHLAVVKKGRAGNARLRLDSADAVNGPFELENEMPDPVKLVTIRLDGIEYQASPEVNNALTKAQDEVVALKKRFDAVEAERDTLKNAVAKHASELKNAREMNRESVKLRLDLEDLAEKNKVSFDADDSDDEIKKNVLAKLRPELRLDGKSKDYIDSAFDLTIEAQVEKPKKVVDQMRKFDRSDEKSNDDKNSAASARQRYIDRLKNRDSKAA